MTIVLSDRVKETTLTEGTADLVLEGAEGEFSTFQEGVGNGKETYYTIENFGRWEVGVGTYTTSTNTLSRDTVLDSNNLDAVDGSVLKISLAGVSTVFVTYPAARAVFLDNEGYATSAVPGYPRVRRTYKTISADETIAISDCVVLINSTSESIEATLPTAVGNGGKEFIFKRASGSNDATINTYSSETIDGGSSFNIEHLYEAVTIISDNSNWYLI